jgi:hypothetical protein
MRAQAINSQSRHIQFVSSFSMKKKILIATLIAVVSGVAFGIYLFNKPHQSILNDAPAFSLDAATLVGEYDKDEKSANAKYLGKIIEVKGVVAEKLKDKNGNINVTLQGADLSGVGCEFEPRAQSSLASLKEGQEVKIKGICTGVLMDVVLVDCVFVTED